MSRRLRRALLSLSGCVALLVAANGTAAASGSAWQAIAAVDPVVGARLQPHQGLLSTPTTITTPLPADPVGALGTAVSALSTGVGLPQDATAAIGSSGLSAEVAGRVANLLTAMTTCRQVTGTRFEAIPTGLLPLVLKTGGSLDPLAHAGIKACAEPVWRRTVELQLTLDDLASSPAAASCAVPGTADLDLWPVLRLDGSTCGDNTYAHDYMLIVDVGGDDTYRNNAGGNMVDLNFSPAGSAVTGLRGTGPAQGCQRAIPGLTALDCVPAVGVLLDLAGQVNSGVKETPDRDTGCTPDPVVRGIMPAGAGLLGVSVLRDSGGTADA
jgi:hypothetical protein